MSERQSAEKLAGRLAELDRIMTGVNDAANIRTPGAASRLLNIDDLQYYVFNRKRVLRGEKALTPQQWFEAER